jgi:hypothetical protein
VIEEIEVEEYSLKLKGVKDVQKKSNFKLDGS